MAASTALLMESQAQLQETQNDRRTSGAGLSQAWGISPRAGQESGRGNAVKRLPKWVCEKLGPSGPRVVTLHLSKFRYGREFNQPLPNTTLTPLQILLGTWDDVREAESSEAPAREPAYELSVEFLLHSLDFHQRENSRALQTVKAAYARIVAAAA